MRLSPNLLAIVPPYAQDCPPAGAASLFGYLRANGCDEFDFLDLRLWTPPAYAPTYNPVGIFGESYVLDVPDLPIVLSIVRAHRENRHPLDFWDSVLDRYCLHRSINPRSLQRYLAGLDSFLESAVKQLEKLDFIGFSTWSSNLFSTLLTARHIRHWHPRAYIVGGGPQVSQSRASAELGLQSGLLDAVVQGEGERALFELYQSVKEAGSPDDVPGVVTRRSGSGTRAKAPRLLRLNEIPCPDFSKMHLPAYQDGVYYTRAVPYQLSRGCTDKCSFCSEWVFWERFRSTPAELALDHIEQLIRDYGINQIRFMDSLLNGHMKRLRLFAEGVLARGLAIRWGGFMRAEMDEETARLLVAAGFRHAFIGIESFSTETLELMNKRRTEADNIRALRVFLNAGARVTAGLIPGFPGDSPERFHSTVEKLGEFQRAFPGQLSIPLEPFIVTAGQPIANDLNAYGLEGVPWTEAVLNISPEDRNITENVLCSVVGDHQGIERLGELRMARVMLQVPAQEDEIGEPVEAVREGEARIARVASDVYILRTKSSSGMAYGLLLNGQELERAKVALAREGGGSVNGREFAEFERQHLVPPRKFPWVYSVESKAENDSARWALSPWTIVRKFVDLNLLVVADVVRKGTMSASTKLESTLERLAGAPRSMREISEGFRACGMNPAGALRLAQKLEDEGFFVRGGPREKTPARPKVTDAGPLVELRVRG